MLHGVTNCPKQQLRERNSFDFYINTNGSLVDLNTKRRYNLGNYCLESASFTDYVQNFKDIVVLCDNEKGVNIRSAAILVLVIIIFAGFVTGFLKSFLIYELKGLTVILVACYTFVEAIFWIMVAMEMLPAKFGDFCYVFGKQFEESYGISKVIDIVLIRRLFPYSDVSFSSFMAECFTISSLA